ncbi:MAG: ATP-dependent DNA helicase RecG [Melioribacteraceae bacterium]|nr:ATP-dependent DNA helicase RecG [Melioribacteraceae bacterium]
MSANLSDSVQYIKSVGPKRAEAFSRIGIKTIRDLLFYFPSKHLDRTNVLSSIQVYGNVRNGYEGEVTIIGSVIDTELIRYGKKEIYKVILSDDTGKFECVWFQGVKFFKNRFNYNEVYAVSAKPVVTRYGNLQFAHPDFDKLENEESRDFKNTGKIIPFYSLPKELRSGNIGDMSIRQILSNAVNDYAKFLSECLPQNIGQKYHLLDIVETVKNMHHPSSNEMLLKAVNRLKFEELFFIETLIALRRNLIKNEVRGIKFAINIDSIKSFITSLPFNLTNGQKSSIREIIEDLKSPKPMNRLLQGDVGSGKTIVSLIAAKIVIDSGYQVVLMAPTEILAHQHYLSISKFFADLNINIGLVLGGQKKKERIDILEKIGSGKTQLIIGTHALFEEQVEFNNLGLIIIDEQHRFGVDQRSRLIQKGVRPDVLIMSATPIPRTLTMSVYGDLDVSIIKDMPLDRKQIITTARTEKALPKIYEFIRDKSLDGYQSFIVYPLVEESDKLELKAAETYYHKLKDTELQGLRVGLIHGKMKWNEKEEIMLKFAQHEYDVLISTTVIEVGIDVPNANIIVINDAFRFGLSQLHQLRGRVGRGEQQAYCVLIGNENNIRKMKIDLSGMSRTQIELNRSRIRINAMMNTSDGFELSEIDLKLRGPGDLFGTQQSGLPRFNFADLTEDFEILVNAKEAAFSIIETDPKLKNDENVIIREIVRNNFRDHLAYSSIA